MKSSRYNELKSRLESETNMIDRQREGEGAEGKRKIQTRANPEKWKTKMLHNNLYQKKKNERKTFHSVCIIYIECLMFDGKL